MYYFIHVPIKYPHWHNWMKLQRRTHKGVFLNMSMKSNQHLDMQILTPTSTRHYRFWNIKKNVRLQIDKSGLIFLLLFLTKYRYDTQVTLGNIAALSRDKLLLQWDSAVCLFSREREKEGERKCVYVCVWERKRKRDGGHVKEKEHLWWVRGDWLWRNPPALCVCMAAAQSHPSFYHQQTPAADPVVLCIVCFLSPQLYFLTWCVHQANIPGLFCRSAALFPQHNQNSTTPKRWEIYATFKATQGIYVCI